MLNKGCIEVIAQSSSKFKGRESTIKTDCDAISITIRSNSMSSEKIQCIKEFFYLFGTKMTFSCGLPNSVIGSKNKDGIFSCKDGGSEHVPQRYKGNEMLVIDTPLKVALHKDCKERLISNLTKKGVFLSKSDSEGLCFNTQASSNKPQYSAMVDAIIQSCYVDELDEYYIHLADFGMKMIIDTGSSECSLRKCFNQISKMRKNRLVVEITQLDIGFMVPSGINQLIQLSTTKTAQGAKAQGLLDHSDLKIYPTHEVSINAITNTSSTNANANTKNHGNNHRSRVQRGTISLKKRAWDKCNHFIYISDEEDYPDDKEDLVCRLFSTEDNISNDSRDLCNDITIHTGTIHSLKVYSSLSHVLMQNRMKFPMSFMDMAKVGERSFIHIQNLLKHLETSASQALNVVKQCGIYTRIEVSIRPHHMDTIMRETGHYNDFLAHVYISMCEFFNKERYKFHVTYLDPEIIETKALSMISEMKPLLKMRSSTKFNDIYSCHAMTSWLQAHMSLLMITIGLAPGFSLRFLQPWIENKDRYDPYKRGIEICNIHLRHSQQEPQSGEDLYIHRSRVKRILISNGMSSVGVNILMQFIEQFNQKSNTVHWYKKLPLNDKLILSMNLTSDIIPAITRQDNKQTTSFIQNEIFPDNEDENEDNHHWWLLLGSSNNIGEYRTSHQIQEAPLPSDPTCFTINCLMELDIFTDHRRPTFTKLLCEYIVNCHDNKFVIENVNEMERSYNDAFATLNKCAKNDQSYLSNCDLQKICNAFSITLPNKTTNQKNVIYLQAICERYRFPCEGVTYDMSKRLNFEGMNESLNQVMGMDLVMKLPLRGNIQNMYYRNADNTSIRLVAPENVKQDVSPTLIPMSVPKKGGYEFMSICLNTDQSFHQKKLRSMLYNALSNESDLQNLFLSSDGKVNADFCGHNTLQQLEDDKKFKLLLIMQFDLLMMAFNFLPDILLPIISIVYEQTIICYNKPKNETKIYVCDQHRSITYVFPSLDVKPTIKCDIIMSIETDNTYTRHRLSNGLTLLPCPPTRYKDKSNAQYSVHNNTAHMFSNIGMRRSSTSYQNILPDGNFSRARSFFQSLEKLVSVMEYKFISTDNVFGIIPFFEELISSGNYFQLFSDSVKEVSPKLSLPLNAITKYLRDTNKNDLSHKILCPIFCLMFKISIGVIDYSAQKKRKTYFYGYDHMMGNVHCVVMEKYIVFDHCNTILYLFSSNKSTGYYKPRKGSHLMKQSYLLLLETKFSHLSDICFKLAVEKVSSAHNIEVIPENNIERHRLRPHTRTATLLTNAMSASPKGTTYAEIIQLDVLHHAIVLVFPFQEATRKWEACIVHHRHQHFEDVHEKLTSFFSEVDTKNTYIFHCVKGVAYNDCESAFYMIIFMLVGHNTKSYSDFITSIGRLRKEENLHQKAREYVYEIMNNKREQTFIPRWIEQLL